MDYDRKQRLFNVRYGDGAAERLQRLCIEGRSLDEAATPLGVSRQYISAKFQDLTGKKWGDYRREHMSTPVES